MVSYKFFLAATLAMFLYQWIPGFMFPVLSSIAWICWIKPDNLVLSLITGAGGLGFGAISLDWNNIASFLGSPLIVPWYTNLWEAKKFPILTSRLFQDNGRKYATSAVMTDNILDEVKYAAYGPLRISTLFALTYGIGFARLSSMITHTWLYHRHKLVAQWKQSRAHSEDIHHRLMQAYPVVPDWWYAVLFVIMTAVAIITCEVWDPPLMCIILCTTM